MFHSYVSTETIARRFIWQQLEQAVEKTKLASQSHFLCLRDSVPVV